MSGLNTVSLDAIRELFLRTDLAYFAEQILGMEISEHHQEWSELVAKNKRLAITASRDHGKSFMFSFAYVIWRIYYAWIPDYDPKFRSHPRIPLGYIFSSSQENAIKFLDIVKAELESNPKLTHLIPPRTNSIWNKGEIVCANGATVRARGWGVAVRGGHPAWAVADDVLHDDNLYSEIQRRKTVDYFFSAVTPMVIPGGQICVIGTPMHTEDLYASLEENEEYKFASFPAIKSDGKALWPTRYSRQMLDQKKREVGSTRFTREYMCVDGDTPIHTKTGYVPIKQVQAGDWVLAHDGLYHRVLQRFENPLDDRKMFSVKTSNGLCHKLTEGHELYVTKTDHRRSIEHSKTEWTKVEDISARPSERVYLKVPIDPLLKEFDVPEELAFIAGWYLAEGHCATKAQQVIFSLGFNDPSGEIEKRCVAVFGKGFGKPSEKDGCTQWPLNSKVAKSLFAEFGHGARNKRIPESFKRVDESSKMALLRAYFAGDGSFDGMTMRCTSVSFRLICDVSDMLLSLGVACQIRKRSESGPGKICGRDVRLSESWELKICGSNLDRFLGFKKTRRNSSSFVQDGFLYSRIKSIEPIIYDKKIVYDLHVEGAHSYSGLHGIFHNCVAISDSNSLFPETILCENYRPDLSLVTEMTVALRQEYEIFTGVDLALSATVGADYTVIITLGVDKYKNHRLFDIRRMKGRTMTDQLHEIEDVYRTYRPSRVYVEDNQFQRVFADELIRRTDIPVEGFTTTAHSKNSLERGVPSLQLLFENKKFLIPRATERDRRLTDELLHELKCFTYIDGKLQGLGSHDDCLRRGSMIQTIDGLVPIEDVKVGDLVLTHTGKYSPVTNFIKKPFAGKSYKIHPFGSAPFEVTGEHPIYAATKRGSAKGGDFYNPKWVAAEDIRKGSHRLIFPINEDVKPAMIDLTEYCEDHVMEADDMQFYKNWSDSKVDRFIPVNVEFSQFLGLYLAEGHVKKNGQGSLAFHIREGHMAAMAIDFLDSIGIRTSTETRGKCLVVHWSSKIFGSFLYSLGKHDTKRLPKEFMFIEPSLQKVIYDHWMLGDGWGLVGATTSREMANQMYTFLLRNGIAANVRRCKRRRYGVTTKDQWWVEVNKGGINSKSTIFEKSRYSAIKKIEVNEIKEDVFNLEVLGDESYVVEHSIVHNCVMSLWIAKEAASSSTFSFTF